MKKSLVITTIATVLVIVVALTTATFAWFSSASSTSLSSEFTSQASSAVFNMYKYESGSVNYAVTPTTSIDFTDISNGSAGTYGYWTTSNFKAMAPQVLIETGAATGEDNYKGLPNTAFFLGTSDDGSALNDIKTLQLGGAGGAFPNVARFKLENGTIATKAMKITVTVTPTDAGSSVSTNAALALRFLMIGVPTDSVDTDRNKGFVFGTQYKYDLTENKDGPIDFDFTDETGGSGNTPDGIPDDGATVTEADYETADNSAYSTSYGDYEINMVAPSTRWNTAGSQTNIVYNLNTQGVVADTAANTYNYAKLDSMDSYEIYLYVWFDGPTAGAQMSNGSVQFEIRFENLMDLT